MRSTRALLVVLAGALAVGVLAQTDKAAAPGVKRNIILKQDMSIPGREAVMATVDFPPGSTEGKHTHPAEVYAFVIEGTITLSVEGQPTRTVKAGEVFTIPTGVVHEGSNKTDSPAKATVVFVAEKGKPLTTRVE